MISDVSIAAANADESPAFVRLRGLTRENAVSEARLASVGITASTWAESIRTGDLIGVTAKRNGALVGYCFGNTPPFAWLLSVLGLERNRVGRRLWR